MSKTVCVAWLHLFVLFAALICDASQEKQKRTKPDAFKTSQTVTEQVLKNERLKVWVDPAFPRVYAYAVKDLRATFAGARSNKPNQIEVNGMLFTPMAETPFAPERGYYLTQRLTETKAIYSFRLWQSTGSLGFDVAFCLKDDALEMRVENIEEKDGFQLHTLYFPEHNLLTGNAGERGASACRVEFSRNERGIIKLDGTYKGPITGMAPDANVKPTHWAFVYTDQAVALLSNNIPVFPLHTRAEGAAAHAGSFSLWSGVYHHRVMGEVMPPFVCTVRFVGDLNGDGHADWMDGAFALREELPYTRPVYDGAFLYKIECCRLPDDRFPETLKNAPEPTVYTTFDQCLEIIRKAYYLTRGRPQIIYLVGWQHLGHDDKYPDLSVVNPYLGGREKLLNLMEKAKNYNATVSLHVNCDGAYKDSPAWDPDIICTNPDGSLAQWSVMHNQMHYHISHYKDLRKGSLIGRVDTLLAFLPIRHSIHYDAFRYTNESWDRDGFIGMTAELLAVQKMFDRYAQDGIGITIEGFVASPALAGRINGVWHSYTHGPFLAMLLHRRWVGGGKTLEDVALGAFLNESFSASSTAAEIGEAYYLGFLLRDLLQRKEMTCVTDDGRKLTVHYGDTCTVTLDRETNFLTATCDGIEVARGDDRFMPISKTEILVYSKTGGDMQWQLPEGWKKRHVKITTLTKNGASPGPACVNETYGTIRFHAEPRQPYLLSAHKD